MAAMAASSPRRLRRSKTRQPTICNSYRRIGSPDSRFGACSGAAGFLSERCAVEIGLGGKHRCFPGPEVVWSSKTPIYKEDSIKSQFHWLGTVGVRAAAHANESPMPHLIRGGGLTSVLSPNDDPLDVIRRLDPGRMVCQKA